MGVGATPLSKRQALRASLDDAVTEQQELLLGVVALRAERKRFGGAELTDEAAQRLGGIETELAALVKGAEELEIFIKSARQAIDNDEWRLRMERLEPEPRASKGEKATKMNDRFKLPNKELFPPFARSGDDQPGNLSVYFKEFGRVCLASRLDEVDYKSCLALLLPKGQHKEFVWRWMEDNPQGSWSDLVAGFEARFQRVASIEQIESQFDKLVQGTEDHSLSNYYNKFVELAQGCKKDPDDASHRRKFKRYLSAKLQQALTTHYAERIEEVSIHLLFERAQQFEAAVYSGGDRARAAKTEDEETKTAKETKAGGSKDQKGLVCHECGKPGHRRGDKVCPDYVQYGRTGGKSGDGGSSKEGEKKEKKGFWGKCHHCGEVGHRSFECPAKKKPSSKDE